MPTPHDTDTSLHDAANQLGITLNDDGTVPLNEVNRVLAERGEPPLPTDPAEAHALLTEITTPTCPPDNYDHCRLAALPEYHAARAAIDKLARTLDHLAQNGDDTVPDRCTFIAAVTDMAATCRFGDWCDCCTDALDDPTCWPCAAIVNGTSFEGSYICPRTGRRWPCWWGTDT